MKALDFPILLLITLWMFLVYVPVEICGQKDNLPAQSFDYYPEFSSKYISPRPLEVWLPSQYAEVDSLAVLYMLDGQNMFHGIQGWNGEYERGWEIDEILDSLITAGIIPPVMVVGLWNGGPLRMSEYMPEQPVSLVKNRIESTDHEWYSLYKEQPPFSDNYLRYMVEEVKPFIDRKYKTKAGRASTYIGGSSMGGIMSAYAICEYPDVFGGAACLSSHWSPLDGVFVEYVKENLPEPVSHKFYFDFGTEGLDAEYEPYQDQVDIALEAHGFIEGKNWLTKKFEGAHHNETAWRKRLYIPLKFLLSTN